MDGVKIIFVVMLCIGIVWAMLSVIDRIKEHFLKKKKEKEKDKEELISPKDPPIDEEKK